MSKVSDQLDKWIEAIAKASPGEASRTARSRMPIGRSSVPRHVFAFTDGPEDRLQWAQANRLAGFTTCAALDTYNEAQRCNSYREVRLDSTDAEFIAVHDELARQGLNPSGGAVVRVLAGRE